MNKRNVSDGWWVLCLGFLGLGFGNVLMNPDLLARARAEEVAVCAIIACDPDSSPYCCDNCFGGTATCVPDTEDPPPDCNCMLPE